MKSSGIRGATAQPAERDREGGDKGTQVVTQKQTDWFDKCTKHVKGPPVGVVRAVVWNTEEPPRWDGRYPRQPGLLGMRR